MYFENHLLSELVVGPGDSSLTVQNRDLCTATWPVFFLLLSEWKWKQRANHLWNNVEIAIQQVRWMSLRIENPRGSVENKSKFTGGYRFAQSSSTNSKCFLKRSNSWDLASHDWLSNHADGPSFFILCFRFINSNKSFLLEFPYQRFVQRRFAECEVGIRLIRCWKPEREEGKKRVEERMKENETWKSVALIPIENKYKQYRSLTWGAMSTNPAFVTISYDGSPGAFVRYPSQTIRRPCDFFRATLSAVNLAWRSL